MTLTEEQLREVEEVLGHCQGPERLQALRAVDAAHPAWLLLSSDHLTLWHLEALTNPKPYPWLLAGYDVAYRLLRDRNPGRQVLKKLALRAPVIVDTPERLNRAIVCTWDYLGRTLLHVQKTRTPWLDARIAALNTILAPACRYAAELSQQYPEELRR